MSKVLLDKATYRLRGVYADDCPIELTEEAVILPRQRIVDLNSNNAIVCSTDIEIPKNWRLSPHYYVPSQEQFVPVRMAR